MEEKELRHEELETSFRLFFHVLDSLVHGNCTFSASECETRSQHATKGSNSDAEKSEAHTARRRGQVAELDQAWNLRIDL